MIIIFIVNKNERTSSKTHKIKQCVIGPSPESWLYEIVWLKNKSTYRADLWGYPDDYDYLNHFSIQQSSPELATKAEAEPYAQREWERG